MPQNKKIKRNILKMERKNNNENNIQNIKREIKNRQNAISLFQSKTKNG